MPRFSRLEGTAAFKRRNGFSVRCGFPCGSEKIWQGEEVECRIDELHFFPATPSLISITFASYWSQDLAHFRSLWTMLLGKGKREKEETRHLISGNLKESFSMFDMDWEGRKVGYLCNFEGASLKFQAALSGTESPCSWALTEDLRFQDNLLEAKPVIHASSVVAPGTASNGEGKYSFKWLEIAKHQGLDMNADLAGPTSPQMATKFNLNPTWCTFPQQSFKRVRYSVPLIMYCMWRLSHQASSVWIWHLSPNQNLHFKF